MEMLAAHRAGSDQADRETEPDLDSRSHQPVSQLLDGRNWVDPRFWVWV
jgi:hypothetical protein